VEARYLGARRKLCHDYETKGKCLRGDDCPFEHRGTPIVLPAAPDRHGKAGPGQGAGMAGRFAGEMYNPEQPFDVVRPPMGGGMHPLWRPPLPMAPVMMGPHAYLGAGMRAPFGQPMVMPGMMAMPPHMMHQQQPIPPYMSSQQHMLARNNSAPAPPLVCFSFLQKGFCSHGQACKFSHDLTSGAAPSAPRPTTAAPPSRPQLIKGCVLEVRGIPEGFNTIMQLNEYFAKFGSITNIHIGVLANGTPDLRAATVQFRTQQEARAAKASEDAVFGKKFIKVCWPTDDKAAAAGATAVNPTAAQAASRPGVQVLTPVATAAQSSAAAAAALRPQAPPAQPVGGAPRAQPLPPSKAAAAGAGSSAAAKRAELAKEQQALVGKLLARSKELIKMMESPTLSPEDRQRCKESLTKLKELTAAAVESLRSLVGAGSA
jgi:hypothetical protein